MSTLRVELLGHVRVAFDHRSSPVRLQRTCESLLAYLVLFSHPVCARDQLITALWGDQREQTARNCLNTALWRLRAALEACAPAGGAFLLTPPTGEIGFNWHADYWLDVQQFSTAVEPLLRRPADQVTDAEATTAEGGRALYRGELLEHVYQDWALREREALRLKYMSALARLSDLYELRRQPDRSLQCTLRILELDPPREDMHRRAIQIYAATDQRPQAIRQYEKCRRLLRAELGIEPMAETTTLYRRITGATEADLVAGALDLGSFQSALAELDRAQRRITEARSQILRAMAQAKACGIYVEPQSHRKV